jgi:hypothetical protein
MSYEEEDACHMRRRMQIFSHILQSICGGGCMSYEEEDACHMRRRMQIFSHILQSICAQYFLQIQL